MRGRWRRGECALQSLGKGVDLIVMSAFRKRQNFFLEVVEPRRRHGEMDSASLDWGGLGGHAHDLVALRVNADGVDILARKILNQA